MWGRRSLWRVRGERRRRGRRRPGLLEELRRCRDGSSRGGVWKCVKGEGWRWRGQWAEAVVGGDDGVVGNDAGALLGRRLEQRRA